MIPLQIIVDGDNCWPDLRDKGFIRGDLVGVAMLHDGTQSRKPTVACRIDLEDGRTVLAETTLTLFASASRAFTVKDWMNNGRSGGQPPSDDVLQVMIAVASADAGKQPHNYVAIRLPPSDPNKQDQPGYWLNLEPTEARNVATLILHAADEAEK